MARSKTLKKLLIATLSVVVFFTLLEFGLRAANFVYSPADEPISIWNRVEDRDLRLGTGLHRSEARTLWGPRPGAAVPPQWSRDEQVNAQGWRGRELPLEKSPGVLRIATLGDSSTFGYGVPYEHSYSAQLQELLCARGLNCEVLDAGVVGYTSRQGLERYRKLVREYKPDIVIEAFGAVNDHHQAPGGVPDKVKIESNISEQGLWTELRLRTRRELRLAHLFSKLVDELQGGKGAERDKTFRKVLAQERLARHMGRIEFDQHGVRRVSLDDFRATLLTLRDEVVSDGGRLVLLSMPRLRAVEQRAPVLPHYSRLLAELSKTQSLPLADGRGAFSREVQAGRVETELFIPGDAYHPSCAGHALLAQQLADVILEMLPPR
jgi:lysophospholipase L1-like esterase